MIALTMLLATALAQEEPCYGVDADNVIEGENFWITWDDEVGSADAAAEMLQYAEDARSFYIEELGYEFTDRTILIRIQESPINAGVCQTAECDGVPVPVITLFSNAVGEPGLNVTTHEVAHAAQYAYMGAYLDAVASWPWWLEGTATWMAVHAHGMSSSWSGDVRHYLASPWLALHQDVTAYIDSSRTDHMYGTALLAQYIEETYGIETIKETWRIGGPQSGEVILMPDVIAAAGLDWEELWHGFMATVTVVATEHADSLYEGPFVEDRGGSYPDSGSPKAERRPQGYGLSLVRFPRKGGDPDFDFEVTFEGDPSVPWLAVLVTTKGRDVGGKVVDVIPLDVGADGKATGTLAGFDGSADGWLVVSPQIHSMDGFDYTWEAGFVAPAADTGDDGGKGCGCATGSSASAWALLAVSGLVARRRR